MAACHLCVSACRMKPTGSHVACRHVCTHGCSQREHTRELPWEHVISPGCVCLWHFNVLGTWKASRSSCCCLLAASPPNPSCSQPPTTCPAISNSLTCAFSPDPSCSLRLDDHSCFGYVEVFGKATSDLHAHQWGRSRGSCQGKVPSRSGEREVTTIYL
jgi:hypothetical protein